MDWREISAYVLEFRNRLVRAAREGRLAVQHRHFPNGCCDDASQALGVVLLEAGIECQVVRASHRIRAQTSHVWLELDGKVIDITADQFGHPLLLLEAAPAWLTEDWEVVGTSPVLDRSGEPFWIDIARLIEAGVG